MRFLRANLDIPLFLGLITIYFLIMKFVIGMPVSNLDFIGCFVNLISVLLMKRENVLGFVFGILAGIILIIYYGSLGLSGQILIRSFYIALNIISIYFWLKRDCNGNRISPSFMKWWLRIVFILGLISIVTVSTPFGIIAALDFTSVYLSISGSIVIAKKKIEGWLIWILADSVNILLFTLSGAYMSAFREVISLSNEVLAAKQWFKKIIKK